MQIIEQQIVEKIQTLSDEEREQVLRYVEDVVSRRNRKLTLGEKIQNLTADVSNEVWEKIPSDGAEQHDRYLYEQLEWLKANRDKYAGKYVALDDDNLVAYADTLPEIRQQTKKRKNLFIVKVFAEETIVSAGL